ncbi:NUDIX domain protein [Anatilimnocola aggregata]|uniref:NUDIX domain protein n=1 Tax=Anatilimnocola aggregata TaxID=2528021 RepID=A0A517Y668_9BACT|nr:NUDIX domain-containing protein [Anatilimnocola aggregata]QDU25723.1 NUDIX domain protein [Anatilimnocola aggregata]
MWANRMLLREKWPQFDDRRGTSKLSAGLLMYRQLDEQLLVFLVHPSGPYLRNQDLGTWSVPKGEIEPGEVVLNAACRRFTEEVGVPAFGPFIPLGPAYERSGNVVHSWAFEAGSEPAGGECNSREVDRAEWFTPEAAKLRIDPAQAWWIDEVVARVRPGR